MNELRRPLQSLAVGHKTQHRPDIMRRANRGHEGCMQKMTYFGPLPPLLVSIWPYNPSSICGRSTYHRTTCYKSPAARTHINPTTDFSVLLLLHAKFES